MPERVGLHSLGPATGARKKNAGASTFHIDLESDVRALMNVQPSERAVCSLKVFS